MRPRAREASSATISSDTAIGPFAVWKMAVGADLAERQAVRATKKKSQTPHETARRRAA